MGDALRYADEALKQDREIVLEAVRQSGDALQCADEALKQDPFLQPASVALNCIAGQGRLAPVANISALVARPDESLECLVSFGFGGSRCSLVCEAGQTLGGLARAIVQKYSVEGGLVHARFPGRERCSPLEANTPLAALASVVPDK